MMLEHDLEPDLASYLVEMLFFLKYVDSLHGFLGDCVMSIMVGAKLPCELSWGAAFYSCKHLLQSILDLDCQIAVSC